MATDIGTGTTVTHANFFGNVLSVALDGMEVDMIDKSHMGTTGYRSFTAGDLKNAGTCTIRAQFDTATKPTLGGAASNLVITWPTTDTWTASAILQSWSGGAEIEAQMESTFTFKLSGGFS